MATTKVSALPETTSPQANDELLLNQSGVSKKVKITNLPAGTDNTKLPLAGGQMTGNITMSGSQTVDGRDISVDGAQLDTNTSAIATKAPIASPTFTGTVAIPNIGNLEAAVTANTAKVTNATHTGDVTGATALTIAADAVTTSKIADDSVTADKLANSINSEIAANTAKVTNATHTGDVTGATTLTIAAGAVDIAMMSATGTASSSTYLRGDNSWATVASGNNTSYGLYEHANTISANYSITSGNNALTAGPITINSGVSVTVPTGSTWIVA
jgi:hypothetical protein